MNQSARVIHPEATPAVAGGEVPTESDVEEWIRRKLADTLGIDPKEVDVNANLSTFGLDSIVVIGLVGDIAEWLNVDVPSTMLWDYPTVASVSRKLTDMLATSAEPPAWSSVLRFTQAGPEAPLFLVHGGGGNILFYRDLAGLLPNRAVYGIQSRLLGPHHHEVPGSVAELARGYIADIRRVQPSGPYFLGGTCFGGVIALEMAQQLVESGDEVPLLLAIEPGKPRAKTEPSTKGASRSLVERTVHHGILPRLHRVLPEYIRSKSRRVHRTVTKRVLQLFWETPLFEKPRSLYRRRLGKGLYDHKRAEHFHRKLADQHIARPYAGRFVRFISAKTASKKKGVERNTELWQRVTPKDSPLYVVPGTHSTVLSPPNVSELAEQINLELHRAAVHPETGDARRSPDSPVATVEQKQAGATPGLEDAALSTG